MSVNRGSTVVHECRAELRLISGKLSCSNCYFIFENLVKDEGELREPINELYVQSSLTSTYALQAGEKVKITDRFGCFFSVSLGDTHFWIYDDVTNNCIR